MKKYLKMSDVFIGQYIPKRRIEAYPPSRIGEPMVDLHGVAAYYATVAINSHDELVDCAKYYEEESIYQRSEANRLQGALDAWMSIHDEDQAEMARLVAEVERLRKRVSELEEFTYHFCDNSYNVDLGGGDCTATTCEAKEMAHKLDNRAWPDLWPGH